MKTADLTGMLLYYWVPKAEGLALTSEWDSSAIGGIMAGVGNGGMYRYAPSTDPADGHAIIERDHIYLSPLRRMHVHGGPNAGWDDDPWWGATVSARTRTYTNGPDEPVTGLTGGRVGRGRGPTALIAAMRAKVASHNGDEVPSEPV